MATPVAEAPLHVTYARSPIGAATREGDSMAKAAAGGGGPDSSVAGQLREHGVRGCPRADGRARPAPRPQVRDAAVLPPQGARRVRSGRDAGATSGRPRATTTRSLSRPAGSSSLRTFDCPTPWCNKRDYGRRTQIRTLLAKGKSLAEIAETLNRKDVAAKAGPGRVGVSELTVPVPEQMIRYVIGANAG